MEFLTDLNAYMKVSESQKVAKNSTNAKAGADLDMTDYLKLMMAMFQNQSIDDVASTSDMMNNMVQMSVIQAVTNLNNMVSESSSMTYAASLVGKEVTIGIGTGNDAKQYVGKVTGTGVLNGEQVIFVGEQMFNLSDVIAVGRVPTDAKVTELSKTEDSEDDDEDVDTEKTDGETKVRSDSADGEYYGNDYDPDDFDYIDDNGTIRIVYKGQDGTSASGTPAYVEDLIPGGSGSSGVGSTEAAQQEDNGSESEPETAQAQNDTAASNGANEAAAQDLNEG